MSLLGQPLATVTGLSGPVSSEPPRGEELIGAQALWELACAEKVMNELDGGGKPGEPLADRLRAHFKLREVPS